MISAAVLPPLCVQSIFRRWRGLVTRPTWIAVSGASSAVCLIPEGHLQVFLKCPCPPVPVRGAVVIFTPVVWLIKRTSRIVGQNPTSAKPHQHQSTKHPPLQRRPRLLCSSGRRGPVGRCFWSHRPRRTISGLSDARGPSGSGQLPNLLAKLHLFYRLLLN